MVGNQSDNVKGGKETSTLNNRKALLVKKASVHLHTHKEM